MFSKTRNIVRREAKVFSLFHIFLMCDLMKDSEMLISASALHLPYIILAEAYEDM